MNPVYPGRHVQLYVPNMTLRLQIPLFMHGFELHGLTPKSKKFDYKLFFLNYKFFYFSILDL